jgi:hypothetical protein
MCDAVLAEIDAALIDPNMSGHLPHLMATEWTDP